jgi:peroxiredoxin
MPTLDALQAEFGGRGLQVLAVSEDRGGAATVEPFLRDKLSLDALDIYLDPKGALAQAFALRGLPTTYVIDARGRVVGHLEGPADWAGPAARALVTHYLERARSAGRLDTGG